MCLGYQVKLFKAKLGKILFFCLSSWLLFKGVPKNGYCVALINDKFIYRSDGSLVPRGARRVEEGPADLVEPLDELQPAELEPE